MKRFLVISAVVVLAGCVSHQWVKEGASEQDRERAEISCKAEALRDLPPNYVVTSATTSKDKKHDTSTKNYSSSDANEFQRSVLVKDCMYKKGWAEIEVPR
ncbi:hypothetical protein [Dryocola sp. BD626]|uniref:hypothetical protein n=1 Tax=Dryocola sp. BD626 TaxID=3133273 RepID=UPI003F5038D0